MRYLYITLLFILPTLLFSTSKTVIQGSIKGFDGESLRIGYYEDYITFKKVFIGDCKIADGSFKVDFDLPDTRQLIIVVEDKQTSLFGEPGQVYNILLSYNIENNSKRAFEKFLDLKFSFPKTGELNQRIKQFNTEYQEFFSKNYQKFVVNEASEEIKAFVAEQESKSMYQSPEYLKNYVSYALANLRDINKEPKAKLATQFLKDKPVLVEHKEYINFFRQLYAEDFEQLVITSDGKELMKAMMFDEDLDKSLQIIQKLKSFDKRELAELYLINGLFEVYYKKTVNQKNSISLLKQLAKSGSSNEIKLLAKNVSNQLQLLEENQIAPEISLLDTEGKEIDLKSLKGKPIYLGFWANWSLISIKDLNLIQKLEETYGEKMHFVSINMDEEKDAYKHVKQQNKYPWIFLYGGKNYELRESYQVKTVPIYYLIDEEGKIIERFAQGPDKIERKLKRMLE